MTSPPVLRADSGTVVHVSIRRSGPGLSGDAPLRLDWKVVSPHRDDAVMTQLAYEIQSSAGGTGRVESARQLAVEAPGGPLRSREIRQFQVRIETEQGWSPWSEAITIEGGLLHPGDWSASAITLPDDPGRTQQSPSPLLRTVFTLPVAPIRARVYVTSLGVHELRVNGHRAGDHLLDPGWTAYHDRLLVSVHDVTGLLVAGENVLAGLLGDGWHRGRLAWDPENDRCRYGDQVALLAQLEAELPDGTTVTVGTDDSWRASTGEIRSADLYDGCVIDLRERQIGWDQSGFDDSSWVPAAVTDLDRSTLAPPIAPPVRVVQSFSPHRSRTGDHATLLDAGQNVAGFVRLTVRGAAGDTVVVRHAEVLESGGALHTRSLRSAKATDTYVLPGDELVVLEPVFTFHGFRYAEVVTHAEVIDAEVLAISSDTARRGHFTCSDPVLTRFHDNVLWSQRDNFVAVPTDCPQRDERLGWTGDAQAFAPTACTLFDARSFWESWLVDLAFDQTQDGAVASVVPNILGDGEFALGRAGWADAATVVPWAVHEAYDDRDVLAAQLPSMRALLGYLQRRRNQDGLLGGEFQFGDWLDPDAPVGRPHEAKTSSDYLANAFFSHSARIVSRASAVLGDHEQAQASADLADELARLTWARWRDLALTTQTGCAVALELQIAPPEDRDETGRALADLVRAADGRIATGFLGTPLVLPALSRTDHFSEAYLMLLRREMPSWLYQVEMGATTVWERWDAIRPDGTIHDGAIKLPDQDDGQMLSFNHYAYGAVLDWVYRNLAGIAPDAAAPGYRHVNLAPQPVQGIDQVSASIDSAFGSISADWTTTDDGTFTARYVVPFGVQATFVPPPGDAPGFTVDGRPATGSITLAAGEHVVVVPQVTIVRPAVPSFQ